MDGFEFDPLAPAPQVPGIACVHASLHLVSLHCLPTRHTITKRLMKFNLSEIKQLMSTRQNPFFKSSTSRATGWSTSTLGRGPVQGQLKKPQSKFETCLRLGVVATPLILALGDRQF